MTPMQPDSPREIIQAHPVYDQARIMPPGIYRTSDKSRETTISHLADSHARGYLDEGEFAARRDIALAALRHDVLATLVSDLPPTPRQRSTVRRATWRQQFADPARPWRVSLHLAALGPLFLLGFLPAIFLSWRGAENNALHVTFIVMSMTLMTVNLVWHTKWNVAARKAAKKPGKD